MKHNYDDISNSQLVAVIDEWVHGERERAIMKRRLIDCICFEPLAEEFGLSDRHIRKIVAKNEEIVFRHLDAGKPEQKRNMEKEPENDLIGAFMLPKFNCQTN